MLFSQLRNNYSNHHIPPRRVLKTRRSNRRYLQYQRRSSPQQHCSPLPQRHQENQNRFVMMKRHSAYKHFQQRTEKAPRQDLRYGRNEDELQQDMLYSEHRFSLNRRKPFSPPLLRRRLSALFRRSEAR